MTDNEWVLVPRTVTAEMEAVYANDTGAYPDAQSLHDAMLAVAPSPPADSAPVELIGVGAAIAGGGGLWRTCTGCHEHNEGNPTGPMSQAMQCHLGGGCDECGGIGAIWDTTDYQAMADEMAADLSAPAPVTDEQYADADALIAHLGTLMDDGGQGGEPWEPAQAAIAGIRAWQAAPAPDYCLDCKGSGEIVGTIPSFDRNPENDHDGIVPCPACDATGAAPAPGVGGAVATLHSDGYWTHEPGRDPFDRFGPNRNASAIPVYDRPAPGVGEEQVIGSIDPSLLALIRGGRNGTFSGIKIRVGDDMKPGDALLYTAPPAPQGDALTSQERHVIEALLDLAYKAWCLADDSEDMGESHNVEATDFEALSKALDVLGALPDDQPGYTMGEAAKARWALRRLIGTGAASAAQAGEVGNG